MPVVTRLNHTRLRVDDLERTVEFYKTILGLEEVRRHTSPRGSQLAFLKAPNSDELSRNHIFSRLWSRPSPRRFDSPCFRSRQHGRVW